MTARHLSGVVAGFKNVSYGYTNKDILDEVSFSIREGSKVTIMGQNGSGKVLSTLHFAAFCCLLLLPRPPIAIE